MLLKYFIFKIYFFSFLEFEKKLPSAPEEEEEGSQSSDEDVEPSSQVFEFIEEELISEATPSTQTIQIISPPPPPPPPTGAGKKRKAPAKEKEGTVGKRRNAQVIYII